MPKLGQTAIGISVAHSPSTCIPVEPALIGIPLNTGMPGGGQKAVALVPLGITMTSLLPQAQPLGQGGCVPHMQEPAGTVTP